MRIFLNFFLVFSEKYHIIRVIDYTYYVIKHKGNILCIHVIYFVHSACIVGTVQFIVLKQKIKA